MLEKYIPDDAPDYYHEDHSFGTSANPFEYIELFINPDVVTGSFPFSYGSYYQPTGSRIERSAILSGKTIVSLINWKDLPKDHKYHRAARFDPDERPYIKLYSRIRGTLVHRIILEDRVAFSEAIQQAIDEVDNVSSDMSYRAIYNAVADWDGTRVKPAEQEHVYDVPRPALDQRIEDAAHFAVNNWNRIKSKIRLKSVADEIITLGETTDGNGFGCKLDRLGYITDTDSPLPPGFYVVDIKTGEEWHPAHLAQTEAYRRSLSENLTVDPHGLLIRLGVEHGDYTVLTNHDDEWDADVLWQLFKQKARWMYESEKSPYPAALEHVTSG